jgi:hypothetical protein
VRTFVYIDGFNLYHRAVKGTPYKWLNLEKFCDDLAGPRHTVERVRYFTAKVRSLPHDPNAHQRQDIFFRAIDTLERVDVHLGQFKVRQEWWPLHKPMTGIKPDPKMAWIDRPEEKGSDVNLGAWLLLDGFNGSYEAAIVVSNDSDLREPVRMVVEELGLPVGICNPDTKVKRDQLAGSFERPMRTTYLADNQLPDELEDDEGRFRKPPSW